MSPEPNLNSERDANDAELLNNCFAIGLDAEALPSGMLKQLLPPKFTLSVVQIDYVKLM